MEKQDTRQLLEILRIAYPNHYKNMSVEEQRQTLSLYFEMFASVPTPIVVYALKNYIKSNQFPPTIAGLQEQIELLSNKSETPADLWTLLEKAIGRSAYGYVEEYQKLPRAVQIWLGEPITLHNLSQQKLETTQSVTRGQFLNSINGIKNRQKVMDQVPEELKQLIQGLSDQKQIGGQHAK